MSNAAQDGYVLGIDIGTSSIGWAVLGSNDGAAAGIRDAGVRIFEAGVDEDKFAAGGGEPPNTRRRERRAQRRLLDRHVRRKAHLLHILQRNGMLPEGEARDVIPKLDSRLVARYDGDPEGPPDLIHHILPYWLRARALDHPLEPHELGRALYHLGQRRGFLSNRKARSKEEKEGVVKEDISRLRKAMQAAGARTLGEYFAGLDPREDQVRGWHTHRDMYKDEFEAIWSAQAEYHPDVLTGDLKQRIFDAIFYQRPLKSQKHLIGECELEPGRKRAPWGLLISQRFRLLQRITDTRIIEPGQPERPPTDEERAAWLEPLEVQQTMSFSRAKKLAGLPDGTLLNWEAGGEDKFIGDKTAAKLAGIFGKRRWRELSEDDQRQVVEDVRSIQKPEALRKRARDERVWALDEEGAEALVALELEPGYCRHSRQALRKLVPLMEGGMQYSDAVDKCYPGRNEGGEVHDSLPPLDFADIEVRNPAVRRCLSQLRKVVNAVVRRYGKPDKIRIELGRDLRKSRSHREESSKRAFRRRRQRREVAERITEEVGIEHPSRADIEKALLWDECNGQCPYTGRCIPFAALFGRDAEWDVDHIIPFRRSLNNSFRNKTLCLARENRDVKGDRTPYDAYSNNTDRYEKILQRVRGFNGPHAKEKLRRFLTREPGKLKEIADRQLNDTRYASVLAVQYLSILYGDDRRITAGRGGVTWMVRMMYHLNSILRDGDDKPRDDHRHHAVDAVAIALTDAAVMQKLSQNVKDDYRRRGGIAFGPVELPWADFLDDVRAAIEGINVSHAPSRKARGKLHEDTFYAPGPERDEDGRPTTFYLRRELTKLTPGRVKKIVDPHVRAAVRAKLEQLGQSDPRRAFSDPANHPALPNDNGDPIPIHKVRIETRETAVPIGSGDNVRWVKPGGNHHVEIVSITTDDGTERWEGRMVNMMEAVRRKRDGEPVVRRDATGQKFVFSLAPGDMILVDDPFKCDEGDVLCVVRATSEEKGGRLRIHFVRATDARASSDVEKTGEWMKRPEPEGLRKLKCQKVVVTPLGEIRDAND
ncbi:MAG: type II CRISPR RNA-guided endonuclease Cas9 [Candidatus Brocadiia bacterium]